MQRITRKRALPLTAAAGILTYSTAYTPPTPLLMEENPHRSAAGTWDNGQSMADVANERAGWFDWILGGHFFLMDNPDREAVFTWGEIKR